MRALDEYLLMCPEWHGAAPGSAAVSAVENVDLAGAALLAESQHREESALRDCEVAIAVQVLSLISRVQSRPWARPQTGKQSVAADWHWSEAMGAPEYGE
jgi:hypothetical protein